MGVKHVVALVALLYVVASTSASEVVAGPAAQSTGGGAAAGGAFGQCKTCVFVLERIKKGTNMLLPAICSELYINYPAAYSAVHAVSFPDDLFIVRC